MKALWLMALAAVVSSPALAAPITPQDAASHEGAKATVEGVVAQVFTDRKSNTTFLDFGAPYPNETFSAVVFSSNQSRVGDLSGDEGKTVDVTGTIKDYRGRPEIILTEASQIVAR